MTLDNNKFKNEKLVKVFSIISLLCTIIGCIQYFTAYSIIESGGQTKSLVRFYIGKNDLLHLIAEFAPVVLLFIYIMYFRKRNKASILLAISSAIIGLYSLYTFIYYKYLLLVPISTKNIIIFSTTFISAILFTISALDGFYKKIYAIIASSLGIVGQIISLFSYLPFIKYMIGHKVYSELTVPISAVGNIIFYITILLFALNNRIPAVISMRIPAVISIFQADKTNVSKQSPEQLLRCLKDKLDMGMITEEEYQEQRAEIINRL